MSVPTVARLWQDFSSRVLPATAPQIQRIEMRRSFYAGFYACIVASVEVADQCPDEDEGALAFQTLDDECRLFAQAVQDGRM